MKKRKKKKISKINCHFSPRPWLNVLFFLYLSSEMSVRFKTSSVKSIAWRGRQLAKGNSENSQVPLAYHRWAEKTRVNYLALWPGTIASPGSVHTQCGFPPALTMYSENGESKDPGCKPAKRDRRIPRAHACGELSFRCGLKSRKSDQFWYWNPKPLPYRPRAAYLTSLSVSCLFHKMGANNSSSNQSWCQVLAVGSGLGAALAGQTLSATETPVLWPLLLLLSWYLVIWAIMSGMLFFHCCYPTLQSVIRNLFSRRRGKQKGKLCGRKKKNGK